jgi:hypothetical protein
MKIHISVNLKNAKTKIITDHGGYYCSGLMAKVNVKLSLGLIN